MIWIMDQKKGLCSHACMECVRIGVSQTSKHNSSKPVPPIWQNVPPSHLPGHCLSCVDSYFCKVVAVPFFFTTRCPALTYPSFRAADTGKKCSVINDRNHLSNVFINVTTKYFQPLPITRTCSTWNILTSKHLLQSYQDTDYTLHKPEAIDIMDGFCQNKIAVQWGREHRVHVNVYQWPF